MPLNIFRFFLNGIVFLLFQNTEQKQIKRKTESREGNLPGSPPGGPALCWPMASQLLAPARAGTEVTPACASSPRRHLLAASPVDELDDPTSRPRAPGHLHSPHRLSLALSRHGRRSRCHLAGVAVATAVSASPDRVQQLRRRLLLRASRAPSARLPRSHCSDLAFTAHRRRSPPPSPPQQFAPDLAVRSVATTVSLATFPSSPLYLSSS